MAEAEEQVVRRAELAAAGEVRAEPEGWTPRLEEDLAALEADRVAGGAELPRVQTALRQAEAERRRLSTAASDLEQAEVLQFCPTLTECHFTRTRTRTRTRARTRTTGIDCHRGTRLINSRAKATGGCRHTALCH